VVPVARGRLVVHVGKDDGEGDCALVPLELHHPKSEIPRVALDVGQPWRPEDDVGVVVDVEDEGIGLERLCINAEWYVSYAKIFSYEARGLLATHS